MALAERPVDSDALGADRPLSSDVARDLGGNLIHIYRKRLKRICCEAPCINSGAAHTDFYTTETTYNKNSVVFLISHKVSPWANNLGVWVSAIDNGNGAARVKVLWTYRGGLKISTIFVVGGDSPFFDTVALSLALLNASELSTSRTITVKVHCIEQAEIFSLGIWETHET